MHRRINSRLALVCRAALFVYDGFPNRPKPMLTLRPSPIVRFGVFEFDVETGDLWNEGHLIRLQEQPRQVLQLLLSHAGELVTREALRAELWPDETFVDFDAGVNVAVNKIRHALRDSASSPRFIETLPRRGYRFIAPVAPVPSHADVPGQVPDDGSAAVVSSEDQNPWFRTAIGRRGTRWFALLLGSVAVVVAGISAGVFLSRADTSARPLQTAIGCEPVRDRSWSRAFQGCADPQYSRGSAVRESGRRRLARAGGPVGQRAHHRPGRRGERCSSLGPAGSHRSGRAGRVSSARPGPGSVRAGDGSVLRPPGGRAGVSGADPRGGDRTPAPRARRPSPDGQSQPGEALERLAQKVAGAVAIHFDSFFGGLEVVSHPPTLDAYREYRAGLETFASDYPRALTHLGRALEKDPASCCRW